MYRHHTCLGQGLRKCWTEGVASFRGRLIHPYEWGNTFEPTIKTILELESIVVVGVNVAVDIHMLRNRFGNRLKLCRDLRRYCLNYNPSQVKSQQALAAAYFDPHVDEEHRHSNFNGWKLYRIMQWVMLFFHSRLTMPSLLRSFIMVLALHDTLQIYSQVRRLSSKWAV